MKQICLTKPQEIPKMDKKLDASRTTVSIVLACVLGVSGCTWVKPLEKAEDVSLVPLAYASDCHLLGQTESNVKDSVGILRRRETKVEEELVTLAKNAATVMGGDTVVAKGDPVNGRQSFSIYKCLK